MTRGPNGLEAESRTDRAVIEFNYAGMYPRFDFNKASEMAVLAWAKRVARCVQHLEAGWDEEGAKTFVYCEDEWREAMGKVGRPVSNGLERTVDIPTERAYTQEDWEF